MLMTLAIDTPVVYLRRIQLEKVNTFITLISSIFVDRIVYFVENLIFVNDMMSRDNAIG